MFVCLVVLCVCVVKVRQRSNTLAHSVTCCLSLAFCLGEGLEMVVTVSASRICRGKKAPQSSQGKDTL